MKKYRFVGKPIEYGNITVIKLIPNMIYNSDQKLYTGEKLTVGYYARMYPEDWEEVTDKDVERQEILDAVNKPVKDNINPNHYKNGKIECIDALESATVNKTGIEAVCVANIIKYLWRYEDKNGLEDIRKSEWYLKKLINYLENDKT